MPEAAVILVIYVYGSRRRSKPPLKKMPASLIYTGPKPATALRPNKKIPPEKMNGSEDYAFRRSTRSKFDERHLEKCFNHTWHSTETLEDIEAKGLSDNERPPAKLLDSKKSSEKFSPTKPDLDHTVRIRRRDPAKDANGRYWTFWKVVFAGVLIRHSGRILSLLRAPLLLLTGVILVMTLNVIEGPDTPSEIDSDSTQGAVYER